MVVAFRTCRRPRVSSALSSYRLANLYRSFILDEARAKALRERALQFTGPLQGQRHLSLIDSSVAMHHHRHPHPLFAAGPPGDRFGVAEALRGTPAGKNAVTNYRGLPAVSYHEMSDFELQQEGLRQAGVTGRIISTPFAVEVDDRGVEIALASTFARRSTTASPASSRARPELGHGYAQSA